MAESCSSTRLRPLLDYALPVYKTHSWDWKRNLKYNNRICACANGFVVLAEGLNVCRLGLLPLAGT
jgi:hypothetical protein